MEQTQLDGEAITNDQTMGKDFEKKLEDMVETVKAKRDVAKNEPEAGSTPESDIEFQNTISTTTEELSVDSPNHIQETLEKFGTILVLVIDSSCGDCKRKKAIMDGTFAELPHITFLADLEEHNYSSIPGVGSCGRLIYYENSHPKAELTSLGSRQEVKRFVDNNMN